MQTVTGVPADKRTFLGAMNYKLLHKFDQKQNILLNLPHPKVAENRKSDIVKRPERFAVQFKALSFLFRTKEL